MDIIAQEWKTPGNLGALARAMKNFGFSTLLLLNPQCEHCSEEARNRATFAEDVLERARIIDAIPSYDLLIGSTSQLGASYNPRRSTISPEQLRALSLPKRTALIIGREGDGMTNEELDSCDLIVSIPTIKDYPVMNASHAAAIILYELSKENKNSLGSDTVVASREEKDALMRLLEQKIERLGFINEYKKETQRKIWRKLISKGNLTKREAMTLFGFLKKVP